MRLQKKPILIFAFSFSLCWPTAFGRNLTLMFGSWTVRISKTVLSLTRNTQPEIISVVANPAEQHKGIADRSSIFGFPLHFFIGPVSSDTRHYVASNPTIQSVPCAREEFSRREQGRCATQKGEMLGGKEKKKRAKI